MKEYLGVKKIKAEPQERVVDGKKFLGYKVRYPDGYESWSPKAVFEEAYRPTSGLTFGLAVEAMKRGHMVAREKWGGYWSIEKVEGLSSPTIVATLKGTRNRVPATPYQEDILAEDWKIIG